MKFTKKKNQTVEGGAEVVYTQVPHGEEQPFPPFKIIASKLGVKFEGQSCTVTDMEELQEFAKVLSEAWKDHRNLIPKLETESGGFKP